MQQHWSFKKLLVSSSLAMLALNTAFAIPRGPCEPQHPRDVCCEEPKPGPFAFAYPKDVNLACPRDFYFRVQFLAMQPKEQGLEWAVRNTSSSQTALSGGNIIGFGSDSKQWEWDLGFRVAMGFFLNHDAWSIDAEWTWFKINEERSDNVGASGYISPLFLNQNKGAYNPAYASGNHKRASARWHLALNTFDLSLGKPFHVSRYFTLHPFAGLRGAWIDQDFTARYDGTFGDSTLGTQMRAKNDFWGVGTRVGINSEWTLSNVWKVLVNWNTSMLYGKFNMSQNAPMGTSYTWAMNHDFYQDVTNMEWQLGLSWGTHYNKMKHHVCFQLLWEFHQWWEQNQLRRFIGTTGDTAVGDIGIGMFPSDTTSRGNLTLSGISARVLFDF